ncbi:MAG: hypothetical protein GOMPHAMPRED_004044 [Gomphillus americanus]|uniref:Mitochondrial-processing peptidase subunit alpha n=1 Tax=Gomphillus americanus TaxID=1940652 RepID=A0A8H3FK49_9LECA|nr:MAG: hypothetical protein GOMPHAMPRED_004044 [Gomphillus americanus]
MSTSSSKALLRGVSKLSRRPTFLRTSRQLSTANPKSTSQLDTAEFSQISTLPNGVRVATEALPGPFAGVGIYVDAGSRYENDHLCGASHIVDRLAFKSTSSRTADEMLEQIETLGGNIHCASSRETLMYQAATFNSAIPTTLGLLAETIRDPLIKEEEVAQQLETADYEIQEIWSKPELILPELVHTRAYTGNTLGNPLLCPKERLEFIDRDTILQYREAFFKPERLVVAFAGLSHQEGVRLTEKFFGDMQQTPTITTDTGLNTSFTVPSESVQEATASYVGSTKSSGQSKILNKIPFFKNLSTSAPKHASLAARSSGPINFSAASQYTGGFMALDPIPPPANQALPRVSHIHVAFEALPISSDDIYALATLQTLLGGGGSFSAGGPGKGMYSRLYTNVLNQHHWVESCVAFNHSYTDSGLFGISASCNPRRLMPMLDVICSELNNLTLDMGFSALNMTEVNRAKNQLKSSLLMNLESRMIELEDLGRQVQVHGRKVGVKEMCAKIDALTIQDLRRVARNVFHGDIRNSGNGSGGPTVVIQEGDEEGVQRKAAGMQEIMDKIAKWKLGRR